MKWRIPLTKGRHATLISTYAPTLDAEEVTKDHFCESLDQALQRIPPSDKIVLLGDFNARVGSNTQLWRNILGKHGIGKTNNNGLRLLMLCSEHNLVITATLFQLKAKYKTSWMHPRSKHWHLLDYVIVRQRDQSDVLLTGAMRGAECWTDHRLIRSKMRLETQPQFPIRRPGKKLNCKALNDSSNIEAFRSSIAERLNTIPETNPDSINLNIDEDWPTSEQSLIKLLLTLLAMLNVATMIGLTKTLRK